MKIAGQKHRQAHVILFSNHKQDRGTENDLDYYCEADVGDLSQWQHDTHFEHLKVAISEVTKVEKDRIRIIQMVPLEGSLAFVVHIGVVANEFKLSHQRDFDDKFSSQEFLHLLDLRDVPMSTFTVVKSSLVLHAGISHRCSQI